jgi:hypothetical protein
MPLSKYFGGHGKEVMSSMQKKYGKDAESIFYATANKKGLNPSDKVKKKHGVRK